MYIEMKSKSKNLVIFRSFLVLIWTVYPQFCFSSEIPRVEKFTKGDNLFITCECGDIINCEQLELNWYTKNRLIKTNYRMKILSFYNFPHRNMIIFSNITNKSAGTYECRASERTPMYAVRSFKSITLEPRIQTINQTNKADDFEQSIGRFLELIFKFDGIPQAIVTWYKDGEPVNEKYNVFLGANYSSLLIEKFNYSDYGEYTCVAKNIFGDFRKSSIMVKIKDPSSSNSRWIIISIVSIVTFFVVVVVYSTISFVQVVMIFRQLRQRSMKMTTVMRR